MNLPIKNRLLTLVSFLLCMLTPLAVCTAQASSFTPADFGPGGFVGIVIDKNAIPENVGNVFIPCQAIIDTNGFPSNYNCKSNTIGEHRVFLRSVISALPGQVFRPAMVNGEPVRVLMDFTIIFACKNGQCVNSFTRNHLHHYKDYGLSYVAPQPIITDDEWYEGYENKTAWARELRSNIDDYASMSDQEASKINIYSHYYPGYVFSAEVNTDGLATDREITNQEAVKQRVSGSRLTRSVDDEAVDVEAIRFIPGYHDGKPESMRFFEATMAKVEIPVTNEATQGDIYVPDPTNVNEAAWRSVTEGRY